MSRLAIVPKVLWTPVRGVVRSVAVVPRLVDAVLVMPDMLAELRAVRADTASLPSIEDELAAIRLLLIDVEANTDAVERLAEVAVPLAGAATRVGRFADRIPQRRVVRP
jgi:hypothetical protein